MVNVPPLCSPFMQSNQLKRRFENKFHRFWEAPENNSICPQQSSRQAEGATAETCGCVNNRALCRLRNQEQYREDNHCSKNHGCHNDQCKTELFYRGGEHSSVPDLLEAVATKAVRG